MAVSRITDSVGRVLGGRYRLIRPLGTGASAHVYVAEDVDLRRRVAIKVLHPALAGDESFLRRFRAEAQVVAALRHPNILRVYDWGEDQGAPYLVMELLEGGSLRALLDRGQLLSPAQAASVGAGAARALDYAHRRGLVHRDVKPANLIFDDEGRLSVADFGLARALAEATWTEPAGAVVGTARYAAPEQVRGQSLDSRADVYALALVLAEATTGAVPFAADTTIGTLMARVGQPLRVPAELGPLAPVLEAAGTIEPADRLDAAGLVAALDSVAAALPPPAPLPLAGSYGGAATERDDAPTEHGGRSARLFDRDAPGDDIADTPPVADDLWDDEWDDQRAGAGRPGLDADTDPPTDRHADRDTDGPPDRQGGRHRVPPAAPTSRRWPRRLALLVAVLLVLSGGAAAAFVATGGLTKRHPVPTLVGRTQIQAGNALTALHFHLAVAGRTYSATVPSGTVLSQRPDGGTLKEGSTVTVTVSLGPQPIAVPALANLSSGAAASVLQTLHLKLGRVTHRSSLTVAAGLVISSSPDRGTLLPGQTVDVVVSTGKPTAPVPSLSGAAGASFAAAQAAMAAVGLVAVETTSYSDTVPVGHVIETVPAAGTSLVVGSKVTVETSKGPHLATVPSVASDSVGAAVQNLEADGFVVSGVTGNPVDTVQSTVPGPGTVVHYGSAVQIVTN